ncbi:YciI family protein [Pelomonas sp. SE-A7]|uniref:YciI family protein n=1 Tax=Pelomonas sp. SE-A7 TaxID=3054953 RepID=UPI00259D2574|nr:YciI family protein [Pelomonas sp. SE-A7]MDM4768515.1 YciI family protein [Pelomonas sp. SE-A7]
MRFMIIVLANATSEAGVLPPLDDPIFADMEAFHTELAQAGVLLDANGLKPTSAGWRLRYEDGAKPRVLDGPFAETKELIAGYTLIQVRSREEAMEWSRRFPAPFRGQACEVEVRQLYEPEDFEAGTQGGP